MRSFDATVALAVLAGAGCSSESPAPGGGAESTFPQAPYVSVQSTSGAVHVDVRTAPSQPPPRGTSTVELTITDAQGKPVDGITFEVVPFMASHGHGTSIKPATAPKGQGKYVVTNVNLFMPGQWELRLTMSGPVTDHATPLIAVP